jgi:hypothetical protein
MQMHVLCIMVCCIGERMHYGMWRHNALAPYGVWRVNVPAELRSGLMREY